MSILRNAINSRKKSLINITEGEEDLLAIPLILELPVLNSKEKYFVFYGQPPITDSKIEIPQGIVIIEINDSIQQMVKGLIEIMEKV